MLGIVLKNAGGSLQKRISVHKKEKSDGRKDGIFFPHNRLQRVVGGEKSKRQMSMLLFLCICPIQSTLPFYDSDHHFLNSIQIADDKRSLQKTSLKYQD